MSLHPTALALLLGALAAPPPDLQAFVGARLIPVDGPEIERGVLLVRDGRIVAIGAQGAVDVPTGAEVVDLSGRTVMPGLVCTHSHVGGPGAATARARSSPRRACSTPSTCAPAASSAPAPAA